MLPPDRGCRAALLLSAAAFSVLLCVVGTGCHAPASTQAAPQEEPLPTIDAELVTVEPQPWPRIVRSQGSLVADEATVLGAKVAGRVADVHVDLGDYVSQGDPLVLLDQSEFTLLVQQAEAQLLQARSAVGLGPDDDVEALDPLKSPPVRQERAVWDEALANLARANRLEGDHAISQLEYDQIVAAERVAEARYSSAINSVHERIAVIAVRSAELSLARQRVEDAVVRASFDGIIQSRTVAAGSYLQVGDPVATLVRTHVLRFRGTIPERYAQRISVGQQVGLQIESIDERQTVTITRVSPALDMATRSLLFEAEISNEDRVLRTGLFAEAEVVIDPDASALIIPQSAVVEFAGSEKVWQVVDGTSREIEILTGERRPEGIQILEGLTEGEVIFRNGRVGRVGHVRGK